LLFRSYLTVISVLATIAVQCAAADGGVLFYKDYDYGSQANYNPLSVIVSATFDIVQISNRDNNLNRQMIGKGFQNVFRNIASPGSNINRYGWRKFIGDEIFPRDLNPDNAQYWPNYNIHIFGGGMTYIATAEWLAYYNYPYPKTLSLCVQAIQHLLNEAVENGSFAGSNVDPIADLLIFDPLGIALFSLPGVPQFFSSKLHLTDWSPPPLFIPGSNRLVNCGQKFVMKWDIPHSKRWRLFYYFGTEGLNGFSYRLNDVDDFSFAVGYEAGELIDANIPNGSRKLTAKLTPAAGVFYDRNGSLLWSLKFGGPREYRARLNIYTGVLYIKSISPGMVALYQKGNRITAGLTLRWLPVGLGGKM